MRRQTGTLKFIILFLILALVGGSLLAIFSSQNFEKNDPQILVKDVVYWNLRSPIPIKIKDDVGVKFVRITLSDGQNETNMLNHVVQTPTDALDLNLTFPKTGFFTNQKDSYDMTIEAVDTSKWNFFGGNKTKKTIKVVIDMTRPDLYILSHSYAISKGGSAIVVFKATDNELSEIYVQTNYGKRFEPTPFYKDGYYAALVAWPAVEDKFAAEIVVKDSAGNENRAHVRYFLENVKYRTSTIPLKDNFLDGKIADLTAQYAPNANMDRLEKMKFINETLRSSNEQKIVEVTTATTTSRIDGFELNTFYPLRNGKKVADFADHRYYAYNNAQVSESWHMGIDFASVAQAPIVSSNSGNVVFVADNGIFGLNIIIDHGFGLYSLYAHCSSSSVKVGDRVNAGDTIGTTGMTGLALGDHLHFGILVQGKEVRPQQWMDKKWIKDNITNILETARAMIDKK